MVGISYHASAAFVDNGIYFVNEDTGQEWLDLTETLGETASTVESNNLGWRLATLLEVEDMFYTFFPEGTATVNEAIYFKTLVGTVHHDGFNSDTSMGIFASGTGGSGPAGIIHYIDDYVFVQQPTSPYWGNMNVSSGNYGIWMVSDTVPEVPIPAAIWLFGTGLLGLVGVARRKA